LPLACKIYKTLAGFIGFTEQSRMLSIISNNNILYPNDDDFYSPDQMFPEYKFTHLSSKTNLIYRAVRDCFMQAGLDIKHFNAPNWNPLGSFIKPGQRVFILCNFVTHKRINESNKNFLSKCSHGSVLRALTDYALIATGPIGQIIFGNAPIQSASWERVLSDTGARKVEQFYLDQNQPVRSKDLRSFISVYDFWGRELSSKIVENQPVVNVKLGTESFLSALNGTNNGNPQFRVSDYNPLRTEEAHSGSEHKYSINQEILKADVVISLPKLKTHEKVGITCGLKGFVGIVGQKDCLAHHRFGGPSKGGDEYPYDHPVRYRISKFNDWIYCLDPSPIRGVFQVINRTLIRILKRSGMIQFGSWSGNDTAWRMALDLARIAYYSDNTGNMQKNRQRRHLVLIDGVVGGEGNGPLSPHAVKSGILVFSDDVVLGDLAAGHLMGWDPKKLAIIREAFLIREYPLTKQTFNQGNIIYNGAQTTLSDLPNNVAYCFRPPHGWVGKVERS
jgi:uncharacterized protein (DUF362 family)